MTTKKKSGTPWKERTEYKLRLLAQDLVRAADAKDTEALYALIERLRPVSQRALSFPRELSLEELQEELQARTAQYTLTLDYKLADKLERDINLLTRRIRAKRGGKLPDEVSKRGQAGPSGNRRDPRHRVSGAEVKEGR